MREKQYTEAVQAVLNRQIKDRRSVKGALVRVSSGWNRNLILAFADGSWAHYYADSEEDGAVVGFDDDLPAIEALLEADLLTVEQYDEYRAFLDEQRRADAQAQELKLWEKLRAKYGLDQP